MKFSIKDFFRKCNLQIWPHLLKKFIMSAYLEIDIFRKSNQNTHILESYF